ncbi:hypothetical protein [Streptomyces sp. NPDC001985]|uniref:hypothetical protein n=1 Tax=Streptomyces sp. NPDC001985 TaxID=3154406 RepID=UPI003331F0E6
MSQRITLHPAEDRFPGPRPAVLVLPGGGFRQLPPREFPAREPRTASWTTARAARPRREDVRVD